MYIVSGQVNKYLAQAIAAGTLCLCANTSSIADHITVAPSGMVNRTLSPHAAQPPVDRLQMRVFPAKRSVEARHCRPPGTDPGEDIAD
jgi:hypothetical protein